MIGLKADEHHVLFGGGFIGIQELGFEAFEAVEVAGLDGTGDIAGMALHDEVEERKLQFEEGTGAGLGEQEIGAAGNAGPGLFVEGELEVAAVEASEDNLGALADVVAVAGEGDVEIVVQGRDFFGEVEAGEVLLENMQDIPEKAVAVNVAELDTLFLPGGVLGQHARIEESGDIVAGNLR